MKTYEKSITHHESIILIETIIDDGYPGSSKVAISGNPPSEMEVSSLENQRTKWNMMFHSTAISAGISGP